jgi:hypothetical protein
LPRALGLGIALARIARMAEEKSWVRELEQRFGVRAEFSQRLLPLLRRLAAREPSEGEWAEVLRAVADAYSSALPLRMATPTLDETLRLFSQFTVELRKMDESLKVLAACLARVRSQVRRSAPGDPIH